MICCLDLEGVLVPEIWINVAKKIGIKELRLTTRDISNYNKLMRYRLKILNKHEIKLKDIQKVIAGMRPLPGAKAFLKKLQSVSQVIILSDTFYEFGMPFMKQLGYPTLLCHKLEVDENGKVVDYKLRQPDPKRQAVIGFHSMYYRTIATGDSYNDTTMLAEAHAGILFKAPDNVIAEFPQFPAVHTYEDLKKEFIKASERDLSL